jgi:hypothetical protein
MVFFDDKTQEVVKPALGGRQELGTITLQRLARVRIKAKSPLSKNFPERC